MLSLSTAAGGRVHIEDLPPILGGEAAVYRAHLESAGGARPCVVKVALLPGPSGDWLLAETARLVDLGAAPATAACVPAVWGQGRWHDRPFVVLEPFAETLSDWVARTPDPRARLEQAARVAEVVAALHDACPTLVHRDLKPTNILIDSDRIAVSDFGAARELRQAGATTTVALATPGYAPPEQALPHRCPERSWDVYGLAATQFFTLTGVGPEGPAQAARRLTPAGRAALAGQEDGRGPTHRYLDLHGLPGLTRRDLARLGTAVQGPLVPALVRAMAPQAHRRRGSAAQLARAARCSWPPGTRSARRPLLFALGLAAAVGMELAHPPDSGGAGLAYPAIAIAAGAVAGDDGSVTVPPFLLGQNEVSQALWEELMGTSLSTRRGIDADGVGQSCTAIEGIPLVGPELPMICVDTLDAARLANALSLRQGLRPAYAIGEEPETGRWTLTRRPGADGWRLPTMAEWQRATRPDPDWTPCDQNVADRAWRERLPKDRYRGAPAEDCTDGVAGLAPVDSGRPDSRGLRQGHGNVAEWLEDPGPPGQRWVAGGSFATVLKGAPTEQTGTAVEYQRTVTVGIRLARALP